MLVAFLVTLGAFAGTLGLHARSVEHTLLVAKHGSEEGLKRGRWYGMISGWGEFVAVGILWFLPQPHVALPVWPEAVVPLGCVAVPVVHLLLAIPLIGSACWFGIGGVRRLGVKASDTHARPDQVVTRGLYACVRHPQYLGWILAHIGFAVLTGGLYLLVTAPLVILGIYLVTRKEEQELAREFPGAYERYQDQVPMLFPRCLRDKRGN